MNKGSRKESSFFKWPGPLELNVKRNFFAASLINLRVKFDTARLYSSWLGLCFCNHSLSVSDRNVPVTPASATYNKQRCKNSPRRNSNFYMREISIMLLMLLVQCLRPRSQQPAINNSVKIVQEEILLI